MFPKKGESAGGCLGSGFRIKLQDNGYRIGNFGGLYYCCIIVLTWNTVTVAHKMLLKCLRSHSHCGCRLIISGHVHSRSSPDSSKNLQNLPPNRYMPSMLQVYIYVLYIPYTYVFIYRVIDVCLFIINGYIYIYINWFIDLYRKRAGFIHIYIYIY